MDDNRERLQKVMAACGVASRRKCEEIISAGKVKVNGTTITELGFKVSPKDIIEVNGREINKQEHVYYALYKPTGYLTAVSDSLGRRTVMDLIAPEHKKIRIFPVGRLDYDSSGLLILTNDGELSYRLTKSAKEVEKSYEVRLDGIISQDNLLHLMKGVILDGVMTKRAQVEVLDVDKAHNSCLINITITEGRNRQVRRMCEALGYNVKKLKRVSFGGISLEGLSTGSYRTLSPKEIKVLYSL